MGLKDCMDYEKSVFTKFDNGMPDAITHLEVDSSIIDDIDLFRIKEKPLFVFVTEKLKARLELFSGMEFNDDMNLTVG